MQTDPLPHAEPAPTRMTWEAAAHTPAAQLPARYRVDGWLPSVQVAFLEALSEGETVERAARRAGMSAQSAYAFRRRAAGAAFSIGWRAALLHAREAVEARLMERALDGEMETVTRPDGTTITRHRYNFRLAITMLNRLDRLSEQTAGGNPFEHAARAVHAGFEEYLDCIRRGQAGDAAAFLGARALAEARTEGLPPLGWAIATLRDADLHLGGDVLEDESDDDADDYDADVAEDEDEALDTGDLVHADRQGWTAEQWQRAEAAGLVTIDAPPLEWRHEPKLPQLVQEAAAPSGPAQSPPKPSRSGWSDPPQDPPAAPAEEPARLVFAVWRMPGDEDMLCTSIAPPEGFCGLERGVWGRDEAYWRAMTPEEAAAARAVEAAELQRRRTHEEEELTGWFKNARAPEDEEDEKAPSAEQEDAPPPSDVEP